MEENKKEELETENKKTSTEEAEAGTGETAAQPEKTVKQQGGAAGNPGLMLLAGAYLLYTGYRLCADVLAGAEGASWGFFAAGAAFLAIGGFLLFRSGKALIKKNQERKAEVAQEQAADPEPAPEAPKKMTIAERARLAENLADKEEQEEE